MWLLTLAWSSWVVSPPFSGLLYPINGWTNYGYKPITIRGRDYSPSTDGWIDIYIYIHIHIIISSLWVLKSLLFMAFCCKCVFPTVQTFTAKQPPELHLRQAERPGAPLARGAPGRWDQRRLLPQRAADGHDGRGVRTKLPAALAEGGGPWDARGMPGGCPGAVTLW